MFGVRQGVGITLGVGGLPNPGIGAYTTDVLLPIFRSLDDPLPNVNWILSNVICMSM